MANTQESFPSVHQLKRGAILGTIAHAIWLVKNPDFAHEQSWDGFNYNVQNSIGARGTITFAENQVVGVFFDEHSPRNPFRSEHDYDLRSFFKGMPEDLWGLANREALQYVLQEYRGEVAPIVTAAFWSEQGNLTASESWHEVVTHGAHIITNQVLDTDSAIEAWRNEYEMSPAKIDLLRSLFNQKIAKPTSRIVISSEEADVLMSEGTEGLIECRELLREIGIVLDF